MCWGWERMHGVTWMSWQKKSSTHNYFLYQDTFSKIKQSLDSTCRRSSACVSIFKGIWFHCTVHYFTCMYDRSIIHRKSGLTLHKASNCLQTSPAISSLTSSKNRPKLWKKKNIWTVKIWSRLIVLLTIFISTYYTNILIIPKLITCEKDVRWTRFSLILPAFVTIAVLQPAAIFTCVCCSGVCEDQLTVPVKLL